MSALVSYESSSDDDDARASKPSHLTPPLRAPNHENDVNGISVPDQDIANVRTADELVMPMIGPTIPSSTLDQEDDQDGLQNLQIPDGMSEQDLIRFLTQATHPLSSLPPSPPGSPNPQTEAKFKRFLELKKRGVHFNEDLARKPAFHNPALLTTLMDRVGIEGDDQYSTSLPTSVWDPRALPPFAFKEELLKSQQTIRDQETVRKKQASVAGKRVIEFTSAGRSGRSSATSTPG
jgi:HCNGP-like protein